MFTVRYYVQRPTTLLHHRLWIGLVIHSSLLALFLNNAHPKFAQQNTLVFTMFSFTLHYSLSAPHHVSPLALLVSQSFLEPQLLLLYQMYTCSIYFVQYRILLLTFESLFTFLCIFCGLLQYNSLYVTSQIAHSSSEYTAWPLHLHIHCRLIIPVTREKGSR